MINYRPLLSYDNERILFLSDGFLKSDTKVELYNIAGLNPPVQINDDEFIAASMEYEFGTINGKLREVIHVQRGTTYTFRIINGGVHFPFRFSIDSMSGGSGGGDGSTTTRTMTPLRIVAADATNVIPYSNIDEMTVRSLHSFILNTVLFWGKC